MCCSNGNGGREWQSIVAVWREVIDEVQGFICIHIFIYLGRVGSWR